jgi:hypothetical protein
VRLLLDSHTLIWSVEQPAKLGPTAVSALQDPGNDHALVVWYDPAEAKGDVTEIGPFGVKSGKRFSRGLLEIAQKDRLSRQETARLLASTPAPDLQRHETAPATEQPGRIDAKPIGV